MSPMRSQIVFILLALDLPERRLGEDQVEVTLTRGFWMGKYEVTKGQWKRVIGMLPAS